MREVPTTVKNKQLVEQRREQIVLAAIKLFSQKGFHQTTLRMLTKEAGISYGNIYDYIGSKDDIFYLIHEYMCNLIFEELGRAAENQPNPLDKLKRMVRAEFTLMDKWADAIMLLYQEGHIQKQPYLGKFLQKEHDHVQLFERAVDECITQGLLRPCQARLVANLIKIMVDSWVLKRWDLRGHMSKLEAEQTILDVLFNGLMPTPEKQALTGRGPSNLAGKRALIVNGSTFLGLCASSFAVSRGMDVVCHFNHDPDETTMKAYGAGFDAGKAKVVHARDSGPMTPEVFEQIEREHGQIDVYIQDFGAGYLGAEQQSQQAGLAMEGNLGLAHQMGAFLANAFANRSYGRIIFIAPWAWDQFADQIRFESVKAGAQAMTGVLAGSLACSQTTVNCVVPGFIKTVRPCALQKAKQDQVAEEIPMKKMGEAEDLTETINFLAGDSGKYLTGQIMHVSGGMP